MMWSGNKQLPEPDDGFTGSQSTEEAGQHDASHLPSHHHARSLQLYGRTPEKTTPTALLGPPRPRVRGRKLVRHVERLADVAQDHLHHHEHGELGRATA